MTRIPPTLGRRSFAALAGTTLTGTLAMPGLARAQAAWPDRPVRVIVPFPGGSTPDIAARAVAAHFTTAFGQPFVVDNRSGAGGNIGTDAIAKATDGHVIGVSINSPLAVAPALYPNLPYDPRRDLVPISLLVRSPQLLVVHPSVPATDLAGFIAYAKANPGKMTYASVGAGSGSHLAMEDFMARTGTTMEHAPYRGFPPAVLDLVAGRIETMFVSAGAVLAQVNEGRVRALAVTADARIPTAPNVPTLAEAGLPDATSYGWVALVAPSATPAARVARLATEAQAALADARTRTTLEAAGFEIVASSPEQAAAYIATEAERWGGLVRRLGIRIDS
ncbi:tripartite-type tricarboxylate transporter receptor subunit TctC [Humitalea rosea]|uniref:Tripartite-type tricarboxylate transporter receptor subunit TctC n=1 Tax=Humitalea rosea TaxID=990373 RepID=A0A2W7I8E1_9PROT|nr:tripartite tricarboxylate transporter substrate binding protein [Humitalea rosea]PZW43156.1 tripartite-type tricarboxylate transporter receptor subunit TctC [Humitalea rosea]